MTYTLIKTVDMLPNGVVPLVVEGHDKMYMSLNLIFLHKIIVMVYSYTVQLQAELQLVVRARPPEAGKPGLGVPWEVPNNGCLVIEVSRLPHGERQQRAWD